MTSPERGPGRSRCRRSLTMSPSCAFGMARHVDVLGEVAIVGDYPVRGALRLVDAQRELPAALDHLQDLAGEPAVAPADGARQHHVSVERALDVLGRHEEIVLAPAFAEQRRDEPVSFRLDVDDAGDLRAGLVRRAGGLLLPAHAGALQQHGGSAAWLGSRRFPRLLAAIGAGGLGARGHPVDAAVEVDAAFPDQLGDDASQRVSPGLASVKLAGELLQGKPLSARLLQRREELLTIDVHERSSRLSWVRRRWQPVAAPPRCRTSSR